MALADEIIQLRDDCLSALDASHNYYVHTKIAWRLVQQMVRQGHKVTIRNQATGHTVNETELPGLAQGYVTGYLVSATFQNQLQFRTGLDAADKSEIVTVVVQKEVNGIAYKRIADWFVYLEKIAQLGCPTQDQIQRLAEIKASRDVLVHNSGIANSIYVDKPMRQTRVADGDALEMPEHYHRESWQLMKQVVSDVAGAGINKLAT